jgi:hypothetical protein
MDLRADDDFLGAIAQQARITYATQQLHASRNALQARQADAAREVCASDSTRVQDELAYYTRQVAHWQDYLGRLGTEAKMVAPVQALIVLDLPPCG